MSTTPRSTVRIAALAGALALPWGLLAAVSPSSAETASPTYDGRVTVSALNVRAAPTSLARKLYAESGRTQMNCKVPGPTVAGNTRWYAMTDGGWASARYIANIGAAPPWCGHGKTYDGRNFAGARLAVRVGPNTGDRKLTSVADGRLMHLVCKAAAQRIDGNVRWYWVQRANARDGWVSARYVKLSAGAPPSCHRG